MTAKRDTFSRDCRCPICHRWFRSEACPHSYGDAEVAHKIARVVNMIRPQKG